MHKTTHCVSVFIIKNVFPTPTQLLHILEPTRLNTGPDRMTLGTSTSCCSGFLGCDMGTRNVCHCGCEDQMRMLTKHLAQHRASTGSSLYRNRKPSSARLLSETWGQLLFSLLQTKYPHFLPFSLKTKHGFEICTCIYIIWSA